MSNYKLITGPYAGEIVAEGEVLDVPFSKLDEDMQVRIREFGEEQYSSESDAYDVDRDFPVSLNDLKREYELSWQRKKTDEDVTMGPYSEG